MDQNNNSGNNQPQRGRRQQNAGSGNEGLSNYVFGKLQPQAIPLEEAVLGALMLDREALPMVMEILRPDSFYLEAHQHIYRAIIRLFERSNPVDMLTVTEELRKSGDLDKIGDGYYLVELTNKVASAANIEYHARILAQKHIQRELIRVSTRTIKDAYEDTTDVFNLLDDAEKGLFSITQNNLSRSYESMGSLSAKVLKQIESLVGKKDGLTGVPTGFTDLDRLTSGWQPSDLIIIAARPGMGKCLGKGTKVLLYDGTFKKVEDVVTGDLLMGDDSTPRKVLSTTIGRENMYWVRQNKGIDYRVNESHILSLKRSRTENKYHHDEVLNITVRDYLAASPKFRSNYKGYKVAVEFPEQELPISPYFLGLWLGDGNSGNSAITNTDEEVIQWLETHAHELGRSLAKSQTGHRTPNYRITQGYSGPRGHSLQDQLRALGVLGNKHIPQVFLVNATAQRLELLAGLIDSDGHYLEQSNGYEITQKNEALTRQIKFLCDSLGFRTSITSKKAQISSIGFETDVWRLRIYGDLDKVPVRVQRKKANPWKSPINWQVTGINVEFDKEDDYYGFELDGNRLFLLEDMTVTHNTAFVLAVTLNAAKDFNKPVALFSLEMASTQLVQRLISMEAEIPGSKMRSGKLEDFEWQALQTTVERLGTVPVFIDDTPGINIFELRAKCRRLKQQHDIQLIIIDYLQLMSGASEGKVNSNREQEIAGISRALKSLAKELSVPVIALSQLSRAVEARGGSKRPQLSDLRECVTGDTKVLLADGRVVPIESLVGQTPTVWSMDNETQKISARATDLVWPVGEKEVFEILLASGRSIQATAEHKFYALEGWSTVSALALEDRIAIARTLPEPENPLVWEEDHLVLLGHLIGDGSYLKHQPLRYTTASEANSTCVEMAARRAFGVAVNKHAGKGNWHQLVFSGNGNRWKPAGMNAWLRDLGIYDQHSHEKHLPAPVFQLSNAQVALLLKHLWATDGTVFIGKNAKSPSPRLAFSTNSERLANEVALLLLRFGIVGRIRTIQQGQYKPMYQVDISGRDSQLQFLEKVGIFGERAPIGAAIREHHLQRTSNTNADTIPIEIFDRVKATMREKGISQRKMASMRGTAYGGTAHFKFSPSRDTIAGYADLLEDNDLKKMAENDLFWDTIVEIKPVGVKKVFDLTVPGTHSWVANGIISHNSGSIEQDADIVSFIYRPEYYQILEDENGQSLKGIAEIIIAKHRHGALDSIRLRFTDTFARFENLDDPSFAGLQDPLTGPFMPTGITLKSRMDEDVPF